jgi:DNA-binding LacI/PurR family transcriptional regulator
MTFEYYSQFIAEHLPAEKLQEYDGIFCSNDIEAYALYLYATRLGIQVPEQLRIVGYDYHNFTRMLQNPRLTTIKQPTDRIGKVLCSTLISMIEQVNEEMINNTIVDVELIVGDTT